MIIVRPRAVDSALAIRVKDEKGPSVDDGLDMTKQFAHEFLQALKKPKLDA